MRLILTSLPTLLPLTLAQSPSPTQSSPTTPVQTITVGKDGTTKFDPESLTVAPGSKVVFEFYPGHHSVVQGSFDKPCSPPNHLAFYSGFVDSENGPSSQIFTVSVDNIDPIWFYCGSGSHCEQGQVGVINPSVNQTLAMYLSGASRANKTTLPNTNRVQGGFLATNNATNSTSRSSGTAKSEAGISSASLPNLAFLLLVPVFFACFSG